MEIRRHLIVPTASGMKLACHWTDLLGEVALNIHVNILVRYPEFKFTALPSRLHQTETIHYLRGLAGCYNPNLSEHCGVSDTTFDVKGSQDVIKMN